MEKSRFKVMALAMVMLLFSAVGQSRRTTC